MARVRFTADFDYRPTGQTLTAYRAGTEMTVRRECADQAVAAGKAEELDPPERSKANGEDTQSSQA